MAQSVKPVAPRCEARTNPLGIEERQPRLSWRLEALSPKARNLRQTTFRVQVAATREELAAGKAGLWDSGKVNSNRSIQVRYSGKALRSGMPVWWRVMVWDQDGVASAWSETAHWTMGILDTAEWKAEWIGAGEIRDYRHPNSPLRFRDKAQWIWGDAAADAVDFEKVIESSANDPVQVAFFVGSADARFELRLNGQLAGSGKAVQVPTPFDLAAFLKPGKNTITVHAEKGKAATRGFLGTIHIRTSKGRTLDIVTDESWQVTATNAQPVKATVLGPYGMAPWGKAGEKEFRSIPAVMLRKEFAAKRPVKRATAYISGLGTFELTLNGQKTSDDVLAPALMEYDKRVPYVTYDVTSKIRQGQNAIGVQLGAGRFFAPRIAVPTKFRDFGMPRLLFQMVIEYADGSSETVLSDESWKVSIEGPLRAANEFDGEDYDARLEMTGWDAAGFKETGWTAARRMEAPRGVLATQPSEPMKVTEVLRPRSVKELRPGVFVFDMGQNMVGWCRLRVQGPAGTTVQLRHAETLRADGSLYVENLRSAMATDFYTLKGSGVETWSPRFIYHGFRYVEVTGYPGRPGLDAIDGHVVHDALATAGAFASSNELLNRLHRNILWGVRGNYRSIPTDCPQRDERQGWLGDRSGESLGETYLYDVEAFYSKWMTDISDSQKPNGSVPDVAPAFWPFYSDGVTWPASLLIIPGHIYDQYGNQRVLERNYDAMRRWVTHMRGFMKDGIMPRDTYGDWCVPPESPELIHSKDPARNTSRELIGSAYFYHLLNKMAQYARVIGRTQDVAEYEALAASLKEAFNRKFFNAVEATYGNGSQTSQLLPLAFGLAPQDKRRAVFEQLTRNIEVQTKGHIGVGLLGAQWIMQILTEFDRADLAYRLATNTTYPSWGYMANHGATTVWELWNGDTAEPSMNSGNHVMLVGGLLTWMYESLAGIKASAPGFSSIDIAPTPVKGLDWVKADHDSPYGKIGCRWRQSKGQLIVDVTIPPNTRAKVHLPDGVKEVGSGQYRFVSALPR